LHVHATSLGTGNDGSSVVANTALIAYLAVFCRKDAFMAKSNNQRDVPMDEHYRLTRSIPCRKDWGGGIFPDVAESVLVPTDYSLSNLDTEGVWTTFQLWDEEGWIGNYKVKAKDFEAYFEKVI
jgi:hypothetical protein